MKILISVSYYSPHISGLTNSIKNLAELLVQCGYSIDILTTQHARDLPREEKVIGVSVHRIPYLFRMHKGFFMPGFILYTFRALLKSDQVIINLPQMEGVVVALLARLMGKKIHCIYACDVTLGEGFLSQSIEKMLRIANGLCLLLSNTVITLTDDFKEKIPLLSRRKSSVKVIYPVVLPPHVVKESQEKFVAEFPKRKYRIGFIGRMAAEKGIEYLLETVPLLKKKLGNDFVLVFAGPLHAVGEEAYRNRLADLLIREKAHVMQIGALEDDELGAFYSNLDVLVLPSINSTEAFGMVQVEAMFCGTPVVASDLPGVRVPIQLTGMGEVVKPKDVKGLAEKIVAVLHNKKKYVKDKDLIREVFSVERIAAQYKEILGTP